MYRRRMPNGVYMSPFGMRVCINTALPAAEDGLMRQKENDNVQKRFER